MWVTVIRGPMPVGQRASEFSISKSPAVAATVLSVGGTLAEDGVVPPGAVVVAIVTVLTGLSFPANCAS